MKTTRTYTMTARAEATADTRRRILQATIDEHSERRAADISLGDIAGRAGVSVQTVLRHFGSRAGLVEEALVFGQARVLEERRAPEGDVEAAVHAVVTHYERDGAQALLMLAQEDTEPLMARITTDGKRLHRDWVAEVFGPYLPPDGTARDELVALLVVATDVYAWKLLRRDRELSVATTENRMASLVRAVLAAGQAQREEQP